MSVSAFATADDLRLLDPGLSHELAELVVEMVSNGIRAGVQWQVDQFSATKIVRPETGQTVRVIFLPARHVTQATVTVGGTALVEDEDFHVGREAGTITLASATAQTVEVTYTAGWRPSELPGIFRTVCLEWAVQYAANPSGVKQFSYGRIAETFATNDPSTQLVIEDRRLDAYSLGPGF